MNRDFYEISFQAFVLGGQISIEISRNLNCRQASVSETNFEKPVSRANDEVSGFMNDVSVLTNRISGSTMTCVVDPETCAKRRLERNGDSVKEQKGTGDLG